MVTKIEVHNACGEIVRNKKAEIQEELNALREASNNETKSTAGDKHETGKVMVQLAQENLGKQLLEVEKLEKFWAALNPSSKLEEVRAGALVFTNTITVYIGLALGQISVQSKSIFVISPVSPLGKQLLGKTAGDSISLNGKTISIKTVV